MASTTADRDLAVASEDLAVQSGDASKEIPKSPQIDEDEVHDSESSGSSRKPTDEELLTLRRVSGRIPWNLFTIAFVELCERFSYYGSSVLYTNFVNRPLPPGSTTGAAPDGLPGALGMGPKAAQGINLFNQFFAYLTPLLGAWIADGRLGRFWTLHLAIGISTIAHVVLVASSAPTVIVDHKASFGAFIIGLLCLCVGTGFFKANVSPLLAEQNEDDEMRVEVRNGEPVIVDPAVTNSRIFLWFYFFINVGSLSGQISMVYVEKYRGFWLAFLIPTILFFLAPAVLWSNRRRYRLTPPTGSILSKFFRAAWFSQKHSPSLRKFDWDNSKPSHLLPTERPAWMTYDDAWVDEIRRGLMACKVFLFLPVFFLAYNQMTGNLTIQAGTMELHGVPNDIIQNLNPISIVIMIPIIDHVVYPVFRKLGFAFTPIRRMTTGFFMACLAMIASAVMQYYIYKKSPCGWHANMVIDDVPCDPAPINVWAQCLPYILIGLAEILTNATSYEYAFSKAPLNMKSLVMAINLFMTAISSAIGQAFTPLSDDPLLVWNYTVIACIAFVGGVGFWFCFRHLDTEEDKWNMLAKTKYVGKARPALDLEKDITHEQ
ncbi:POT family-domain-containing protein [Aspergillus lucknowensis]|uniref:POT family-domain-containing protein n=1 Tax=Aspergillus lucknowensis TaxID=176173 RepID=A0ABR4LRW8_9EURO